MKSGHLFWAKNREMSEPIDLQGSFDQYWRSTEREFTIPSQSRSKPARSHLIQKAEVIVVGKHRHSLEVHLSTDPTVRLFAISNRGQLIAFTQAESLRSSLHQLEKLLEDYSPLMSESTERVVDKAIKYGAVFAGVSPTMSMLAGC